MNYWPYLVALVVLAGLMAVSIRNRRRQAAEQAARAGRIGVGTEVMTTSGLYGTVVGRNQDDTVTLSIAPGVEVKWAVAALRDASALPGGYRRGIPATADGDAAGGPRDSDSGDSGPGDVAVDLDVDGKTYDDVGDEVQLHKLHKAGTEFPNKPPSKSRNKSPNQARSEARDEDAGS